TGTWPKSSGPKSFGRTAIATTPRVGGESPAPGSMSDGTNPTLGKSGRVGSGRGHDARACASDDVAECFIAGRGEVLFVGLLVVVPGLRIPYLQVVDRSDHHAVLGELGVAAVVGGQRDAALRVGMLLV